jgi:hypothetical protein
MVHIQTQGDLTASSSIPMAHIRRNFRGSIFSRPVAGQPEAHAPQVRHKFRLPSSGRISLTLSIKELFFFPLIVMVLSDIDIIPLFLSKLIPLSLVMFRSVVSQCDVLNAKTFPGVFPSFLYMKV